MLYDNYHILLRERTVEALRDVYDRKDTFHYESNGETPHYTGQMIGPIGVH